MESLWRLKEDLGARISGSSWTRDAVTAAMKATADDDPEALAKALAVTNADRRLALWCLISS